jgi:purine-binding chemotaxis protein CheW
MNGAMLVTRIGGVACAIPIEHVVETMRPLPVEPLGRSADPALTAIEGVAMIRGAPVPVIDARRLLGVTGEHAARFVVVRTAERRIALVVDRVIEVKRMEADVLSRLPSLLGGASSDWVAAIGARDAALLVVLDVTRVLPEDGWRAFERAGAHGGAR